MGEDSKDVGKLISDIIDEIDSVIEKGLGDVDAIGADVYPFIYDFYTSLTNMSVVHKKFDIKRYYTQYNIFPESFLNVPFVRGIRISPGLKTPGVEEALSSSLVHLRTIKKQGKAPGIWKKSKGTFVCYANIKKMDKVSRLIDYVIYFNSMYAKPIVKIEEKNTGWRVWYYDKIYPTPFSYFSTQLKSGASVLMLPFTGFLISKLENENRVSVDIGGGELTGKYGISYVLVTNLGNTQIRYLGPYPTFFPDYKDFTEWEVNEEGFLMDYYMGFIIVRQHKGYLLNDIKNDSHGFIIPIMNVPFSSIFYAYATFGHHYCDKINIPIYNIPIEVGKIRLDEESIFHFKKHLEGVKHNFRKRRPLKDGSYESYNLYGDFLKNYFEEIKINETTIIDPISYFYLRIAGISKEDILEETNKLDKLIFGDGKNIMLKISRICDLKRKYLEKVRNLVRDNHLYVMI